MLISKKITYLITGLTLLSSTYAENSNKKVKDSSVYTIPIIFASSDVGVGYGAQVIYINKRDDSILDGQFQGILTTKDQKVLNISTQKQLIDSGNILELSTSVTDWKSTFYGLGNSSSKNKEESYVSKNIDVTTGFKKKMSDYEYLGFKYIFKDFETTDLKNDGLLDKYDYNENGVASGFGINYTYDKRDLPRNPKNGYIFYADSRFYGEVISSDYDFQTYSFDAKAYKEIKPNHIAAIQFYTSHSGGDVPFAYLESLGSSNLLRGYLADRYLDKAKLAFQGEYRYPIYGNFTGVAFASSGQVSSKISNFELDDFKSTIGAGIKYVLSEEDGVKIRCDIGINEDGETAFYIDFGDAF